VKLLFLDAEDRRRNESDMKTLLARMQHRLRDVPGYSILQRLYSVGTTSNTGLAW
jgi:hypothetical protein